MWRWRWWLWGVYVAALTAALVLPVPATEGLPGGEFISARRYFIAKSVHVSAYALMAVLSAWLRVPLRYRWLLAFFLAAHAAATELTQWALTEAGWSQRTGTLQDVGYDFLGLALGIPVAWKWWTSPDG